MSNLRDIEYWRQAAAAAEQAGDLPSASAACRELVAAMPRDAALLGRLGLLEYLLGNLPDAIDCLARAARLDRRDPTLLVNLGLAQHAAGRQSEAAGSLRKAIALKPDLSAAHNNLGLVLSALGEHRAAVTSARRAVALAPADAQARYNLGNALFLSGQPAEARSAYLAAIAAGGPAPEVLFNLGNAERALGCDREAIGRYREAVALDPAHVGALINLGNLLMAAHEYDEALDVFTAAAGPRVTPADTRDARTVEARYNLANLQRMTGQLDAAMQNYRDVLAAAPMHELAFSNLLLTMNYSERVSREEQFAAHVEYGRRFAPAQTVAQGAQPPSSPGPMTDPPPAGPSGAPATGILPVVPARQPEAMALRIGFMSADLRDHAVARFVEPLIDHLPAEGFEVFCYSSHDRPDAVSARLRAKVAGWHDILDLDDTKVADRVRRDRIDVLVDLAGHTAGHRLRMFALRPAPVQVTMIGHVNTTGVAAIDYRVTDAVVEPPGQDHDRWYTEKLLRLAKTCWCMRPADPWPPAPKAPRAAGAPFAFASFNNFAKLSDGVLDLWARMLRELPDTRLVIVTVPEGRTRARLLERFVQAGVDASRLELQGYLAGDRYRDLHSTVDLALDPFPCNGATTTIDTLWLGVPVLALEGDSFRSRNSSGILFNAGLGPLIARSPGHYLEIARRLVGDPDELARLRALTGEHLRQTPLMDGAACAADLAVLLREAVAKARLAGGAARGA